MYLRRIFIFAKKMHLHRFESSGLSCLKDVTIRHSLVDLDPIYLKFSLKFLNVIKSRIGNSFLKNSHQEFLKIRHNIVQIKYLLMLLFINSFRIVIGCSGVFHSYVVCKSASLSFVNRKLQELSKFFFYKSENPFLRITLQIDFLNCDKIV